MLREKERDGGMFYFFSMMLMLQQLNEREGERGGGNKQVALRFELAIAGVRVRIRNANHQTTELFKKMGRS